MFVLVDSANRCAHQRRCSRLPRRQAGSTMRSRAHQMRRESGRPPAGIQRARPRRSPPLRATSGLAELRGTASANCRGRPASASHLRAGSVILEREPSEERSPTDARLFETLSIGSSRLCGLALPDCGPVASPIGRASAVPACFCPCPVVSGQFPPHHLGEAGARSFRQSASLRANGFPRWVAPAPGHTAVRWLTKLPRGSGSLRSFGRARCLRCEFHRRSER